MPEKIEELRSQEGISRRGMLKRLGAGAAVAWSAPVITSLSSPAFAQTPVCSDPCSTCFSCPDPSIGCPPHASEHCGGPNDCFDTTACYCSQTIEGECVCAQNAFGQGGPCDSSATCAPFGEVCMIYCGAGCVGPGACLPPCGSSGPRSKRRAGTPAARR